MFKVNNNKDTRTTPYFTRCSSVSIVNFEQVNADWVHLLLTHFMPLVVFFYTPGTHEKTSGF